MSDKIKISLKEKEGKLLEKIEKAKQDLARLKNKRKSEIGKLACKHGLDALDDDVLDRSFAKLSEELLNENP